MLIKNGLVFANFALREGDVYTEIDRISEPHSQSEVLDATGCIVAPGFIDIHIHGAYGTDFCDSTREAHENIARYLASVGVTSYLITTMAMKKPVLLNMIRVRASLWTTPLKMEQSCAASISKVHLPPLRKKAPWTPITLIDPDYDFFLELNDACSGRIRLNDVAPEKPGALDFIARTSEICVVSLHHTSALRPERSLFRGAGHVTASL